MAVSLHPPLRPLPDRDVAIAAPARDALAELLDRSGDYVVQADRRGAITYLNPAARGALGLADTQPDVALHATDFTTPAARRQIAEVILPALHADGRWAGQTELRLGATGESLFSHTVVAHRGRDGRIARFSAVLRDISDEQQARHELQRQTDVLRAIAEAIPATVVVVDSEGRYRFANSAFERQCGLPRERILGRRVVDVLGADEIARRKPYMQRAYAGEAVEFTLDYPGPEGTTHLALSCIPLKLAGAFDGFVGISQNVTQQRREQDRLVHLAERDPLTGLLNRAGFERRIESLAAGEAVATLALLYIDLDHFKPVNDTHGHPAGDRLLQLFAERLGKTVRTGDTVARLGGDEFAVLVGGLRGGDDATVVAQKIVATARDPFDIDGRPVRVGASVGVAFGLDHGAGWRELVARADTMLYRAKAAGRGCFACDAATGARSPAP